MKPPTGSSRVVALAVLSALLTARGATAGEEKPEPLALAPDDTCILDQSIYAGKFLQHYLLKHYVGPEAAEPFRIDSKADRAASPGFPLLREGRQTKLPEGKKVIAVGDTRFLSAEDRKRLEASPGAILLKRQGDVVVVAGSPFGEGWTGSFTAMLKFLDTCAGIRFYAPGDLWVSRPTAKTITIGDLDLFQKQVFASSGLGQYLKRNQEWLRMNPNTSRLTLRANHSLASIFPPERHAKAHPEIYPMKGAANAGRSPRQIPQPGSGAWNPCLSAEALPQLAMDYVREKMRARPRTTYVSFGVMDCLFTCECPACRASVEQHGGSYSNLYYAFLNQVARQCQKEFPRLWLTAYVYSNVRTPPVGMRIEPNIVVDVVVKSYRWVIPAHLEWEKSRIRAFSDLGASWIIHDWCFSGVSPRSYMAQMAAFLQWAAQNRMIGAYFEWSPGESWYLDGAKYWILMQLMSDPYQDVDLLWKRYCDDMYGAASETLFRFFRHFADKYVYAPDLIELRDLPREEPALFTAEDLAYQRALLEKAIAQTKDDPVVQQRLGVVMRYFRGHELFAQAVAEPYRLEAQWKGGGINRPALAYYLNEKGNKLAEAVDYYLHQRTLPPDEQPVTTAMGALPSYIANYTRAKKSLLAAIERQALASVDLANVTEGTAGQIVAASRRILRENLPDRYDEARLREFAQMLDKVLWVPTVAETPKLDGHLSDPVWQRAALLKGFAERDTLKVSSHGTSGKALRAGDRLVVGVRCQQDGPIWAATPREVTSGTRIWRESGVEFFFGKADGGSAPFAQYVVNALGAFRGFRAAAGNREGVEVAVRLDRDRGVYTIEAALPLKAKGYDFAKEKVLSFNLMRNVYTRDSFAADVILGWHPIFYTAQYYASRGLILME